MRWATGLLLATAVCLPLASAQFARAQVPVVSPDDVTTPVAELEHSKPEAVGTPSAEMPYGTEESYIVQEGDTLWSVALEIGVDLKDMPCAISPTFHMDQPLVIGDSISPPPAGTICHRVARGETVASIAATYGVAPNRLTGDATHPAGAWNQLTGLASYDSPITEGRYVRISSGGEAQEGSAAGPSNGFLAYMLAQPVEVTPFMAYAVGGPKAAPTQSKAPPDWPYGSGRFTWPVYGWVSQGYRNDHRAVDIAAPLGTFVMAADRGVVVRAGWNNQGYGMFVVIDHNIDYVTLYSHLQDVYVDVGDIVAQGEVIGSVGSTGNSTGPHLHFELRDFGARTNPLEALLR